MQEKVLFTFFALLLELVPQAQDASAVMPGAYITASGNFVRVSDLVQPTADVSVIGNLPNNTGIRITTQYFDGLGRLLQTVSKGGSLITSDPGATANAALDLVSPVVYDAFGREVHRYLSFARQSTTGDFSTQPFKEQKDWYDTLSPIAGQGYTMYYGKTEYEPSPLNRPLRQYAAGDSWVKSGTVNGTIDRSVKTMTTTNTSADLVRYWTVTNATVKGNFGTYRTTANYAIGTLHKIITEDEQGVQSIEYKDFKGRVVMKKVLLFGTRDNGNGTPNRGWQCTYYIYDDLDRLRAILQPRGTELIRVPAVEWDMAKVPGILNEQFFRYEYDERGLMILKKVPGAAPVFMVYDARDRLVMTQDGLLRSQSAGRWAYTEYDNFNRPVATGLVDLAGSFTDHLSAATSSTAYPVHAPADDLTNTFYDDYSWLNTYFPQGTYDGGFAAAFLLPASSSGYPYPVTPVPSTATRGMVTGTRVKVLGGSSTYLLSAIHYDDRGRVIQVKSSNLQGGINTRATQYSFSGQPLLVVNRLHNPSAVTTAQKELIVATRNTYDELGRLLQIDKKINNPSAAWKRTAYYQYNALGQMRRRRVGTQPAANHQASLIYEYNIRGWMIGINKEYIKSTDNNSAFFGMDLCYDRDGLTGVNKAYNGNIAATHWRSRGDFVPRKYQFAYDLTNRLLRADFTQREGSTWTNANVNFDVKMGNGMVDTLAYDMNGNILQMQQWGLLLNGSQRIDNLKYRYRFNNLSNKLQLVTDDSVGTTDFKLGDFLDKNLSATDYTYDTAGNMISDANKSIQSITYNHLNLPQEIVVLGKGSINYTYDAGGNKLRKTVFDSVTRRFTTTLYLNGTVYQNDTLQFTAHEEGRFRYQPRDASFQWDYYLKDHLGNVRAVVTEEKQQDQYPAATLEGTFNTTSPAAASMINEERKFYTIDNNYVVNSNTMPGWTMAKDYQNNNGNPPPNLSYPPGTSPTATAISTRVYRLNANTNKTGLGMVLKVMVGDTINIHGRSYYQSNITYNNDNSAPLILADLAAAFVGAPGGMATAKGMSSALLQSLNTGLVPATFFRGNDNTSSTQPKAYINYLFFDEQFRYCGGNFSRVGASGTVKNHWFADGSLRNVRVPKNGYLYVYVSNESRADVFFDNLQVFHTRGPLLEETHYYPFGLTMQGISSKAAGEIKNKMKFVGQELDEELELNWYQFRFRNHDPQLGRFVQIDPLASDYLYNSTYAYAENRPIDGIDLEGLEYLRFDQLQQVNYYNGSYQNSFRSESTNPNYQVKALSAPKGVQGKAVPSEPIFSLSISVGAVVGVKAGMAAVELNGGSKELVSISDQGVKAGNLNETKKGMDLAIGIASISGESATVIEATTMNTPLGTVSYDKTTTTNTYKGTIGISKTPLQVGTQRQQVYEQYTGSNGATNNPVLVSDSRSPTMSASRMLPVASPKVGNTKVSVAAGVKIEIGFNFLRMLEKVHN